VQEVNPGMFSRIAHTFNLPDYEPLDLARIFGKFLEQHGWQITARLENIAGVFAQVPKRLLKQTNGMNAHFTVLFVPEAKSTDKTLGRHAARLVSHLFLQAQEQQAQRWSDG
jgi:hypothetical protein